jgi:hypothetical protein
MRSTRVKRRLWIVIAFAIVALLAACQKRVPIVSLPPVSAPAPVPVPPPPPAPSPLDQADRAFGAANYDEAARGYEGYLRVTPSGGRRDEALFYLGLSYALRPPATADWTRASTTLKQLVDEFPSSIFKPTASLILSMRTELDQLTTTGKQRDQQIKQLSTELDRLKKIDADRRKRP